MSSVSSHTLGYLINTRVHLCLPLARRCATMCTPLKFAARGECGLMIMIIQQVRERENGSGERAWGSGSGCPTSGKVAADCPPRPIGRVREPASEPAIVLSPGLAVTIPAAAARPADLSGALPPLSPSLHHYLYTRVPAVLTRAPAINRARLSAARSRRSRRRSDA